MKLSYLAITAIMKIYYYKDPREALEKLDLKRRKDGKLHISKEVERRLENHEDLVD